MKIHEFINVLENDKVVPGKIVDKLRSKIEQSEKEVSAKSVAKYLVDKGYLSKYQVQQIFTAAHAAPDEIELQVPQEQVNDTNELLQDLNPAPAPEPATDATRVFAEGEEAMPAPDVSIDVVDVAYEATMQQPMDLSQQPMEAAAAAFDPLGGGLDGPADDPDAAPDAFVGKKVKTNQWESKWLFIGSSVLALLVMVGVILAFTIFKADVEKSWEALMEDFKNQRYAACIEKVDNFIKNFSSDDRVVDANVIRTNCLLRIPYDSKQWEPALTQAQTELPKLSEYLTAEEKSDRMGDIRDDLGVILPGTALGFTRSGLDADDVEVKKQQLALAFDAKKLVDDPNYVPGSTRRKPGVAAVLRELEDNIKKIEREIQMEKDYVEALASMKTLTEEGNTNQAFEVFENLTVEYPILKVRDEIQEALENISLAEADLVKSIDPDLSGAAAPESIGKSIVLATRSGQNQIPGIGDEMLVHLIDGSIYGIKASTGEVVWRKFVGIETTIHPQWMGEPNRSDVIAADSRLQHLMRISYRDGKEVWRTSINEPFVSPTVTETDILLSTNSGKVMQLEPDTGMTNKAAQIPKMASLSGFTIGTAPFIYQLGDNSNLYAISKESMACREVYYIGHDAGSISIPPFVVAGHVIIAVNGNNYCTLHVLKPTENGLKLEKAQPNLRMEGQVNTPVERYNRWGIIVSDTGDMKMLEINKADEEQPVTVVVDANFSNKNGSRRNYLNAKDGKLWISGRGLRRYKVIKNRGVFDEQGLANNLDSFIAPNSVIGDTLFHVRRRSASRMVSVSAVDSISLKEVWRNDFAAPLAGTPFNDGTNDYAVSAQGDVFRIDAASSEQAAINQPVARASTTVQSLQFADTIKLGDRHVVVGTPKTSSISTIDFSRDIPVGLASIQRSAEKLSAKPAPFGNALLVATRDGKVFKINPLSGKAIGAPFQPAQSPNKDVKWRAPAVIEDGGSFLIGNDLGQLYLVEADGDAALKKSAELELDGELLSGLMQLGGNVYGVVRGSAGDQLTQFNVSDGLEVADGALGLESPFVAGPTPISDSQFILMQENGNTVCFDTSLQQVWEGTIPPDARDRMAGSPVMIEGKLMMAFQSGTILTIDPADGSVTDSVSLGQPIAGAPTMSNGRLLVPGADGTLHILSGN